MITYRDIEIYQTPDEQAIVRKVINEIKDVPGDMAEVGVYQGGTAAIIREENKEKSLYLFDTFAGFADELHETDSKRYFVGDCSADEKIVRNLLKDEQGVTIVKGTFPETADCIKDKTFAFVHIDVDIYNATKNTLEFFYTRVTPGGIILVHDYPAHRGVKKAVDEFMKDKLDPQEVMAGGRQLIIRKI